MLGKRMMLFVDAQNLFFGGQHYAEENGVDSFDVDAIALRDKLSESRDLIRSYWFDSFHTEDQIQKIEEENGREISSKQPFFHFLEMNGFRVDAKPLRDRGSDGFVEKGADIGLASELLVQGFNDGYDVAVVVTGDSDFSRSIRYVQNIGKTVEVASFEANISSDFKRVADEYTKLDDIAEGIKR